MPYITDAVIKAGLAARLGYSQDEQESHWDTLARNGNNAAYGMIRRALVARGYSATQIDQWDDREEFNLNLAICYAIRHGATTRNYDQQAIDKICQQYTEELKTVSLLVSGELVTPSGAVGSVSRGTLSTDNDTFTTDMDF